MYIFSMENIDARTLSSSAQQIIRLKSVAAVEQGKTHQKVSELFGIARGTITKWVQIKKRSGIDGLKSRKRGRPPASRLKGHQAATIVRIITDRCPEQVKLPFALWTREAVQMLIERRYSIRLSIWTIGRYLHAWGFSPQKPQRKAYERNDAEVQHWLTHQYPAIKRTAKTEGAEILWGDETGMRSDHQAGTTWAPKGQTPTILCTGKRFRCNMISGITNRGRLEFRLFRGKFTSAIFIDFMKRLIKYRRKRVIFIVDGHPVHKSGAVKDWLEKHGDRIKMILMPGYSPELNPDELLNQDVKTNAVGRQRAKDIDELEGNVGQFMAQRQAFPELVKKYFHKPSVVYAA
jgi:transposase